MFKYVCQNFKDGQVLTADCLNKMEEGIENACQTPGPQGPNGDDGKSAYEYARDGGYMGSETKFSEHLAGIPDWDKVDTYTANDTIVIPQQSLSIDMWTNRQGDIELGIPYAVYINGTEYFCIAGKDDDAIYLGNPTLFYSASKQPHNNEPFCITWAGGNATAGMFFKDSALSYPLTLKVTGASVTTEKKLPKSYLPNDVALKSDIPEGGGGGGADIDVIAEVGQTIVVEEVDVDGKPTKWKAAEYQPRTHWSEYVTELPETQLTDSGAGYFFAESQQNFIYGDEYRVTYNGVEYNTAADLLGDDVIIGNLSVFGGEWNNGLPFFAAASSGIITFVPLDGATAVTLKIERLNNVKIPNQFLPKTNVFYIDFDFANESTSVTYHELRDAYVSNRVMLGRDGVDIYTPDYINFENRNGDIVLHNIFAWRGDAKPLFRFVRLSSEDPENYDSPLFVTAYTIS